MIVLAHIIKVDRLEGFVGKQSPATYLKIIHLSNRNLVTALISNGDVI